MMTLILMGIGAALMYFFDPDSGRRAAYAPRTFARPMHECH